MTSIIYEYYQDILKKLKEQYPYVANETKLKNALMIVREREGIKGDFTEEYEEIDKWETDLPEPTEEQRKAWNDFDETDYQPQEGDIFFDEDGRALPPYHAADHVRPIQFTEDGCVKRESW